jgi:formylglycine-generating enzyme required for sulfatase activity
MKTTHLFAILLANLIAIESAQAVTIDMVTIGNPGNAGDSEVQQDGTSGYGSVGYVYQIGKYEVTAGQYTEFLNAVAKDDLNGLYNSNMSNSGGTDGANIQRSGSSPNFSYSVAADWSNRPVNYVSFWDAARFANWLHNGQPTGPQGPGTTEDGAYLSVGNQATFARQPGAKFFLPTENEWYKAAFHKNDGVTGNYWDYPTASNTAPINTLPDPGNHANFWDGGGTGNHTYTIDSPYYRTEVGSFVNSPGPYGTFDQAGNVSEFNETVLGIPSARGLRGGNYDVSVSSNRASDRGNAIPADESPYWGIRVAGSIPEPSTLFLAAMASFGLLLQRRAR